MSTIITIKNAGSTPHFVLTCIFHLITRNKACLLHFMQLNIKLLLDIQIFHIHNVQYLQKHSHKIWLNHELQNIFPGILCNRPT